MSVNAKQSLVGSLAADDKSLVGSLTGGEQQSLVGTLILGKPNARIEVTKVKGGHKITITDPNGVQQLTIRDGSATPAKIGEVTLLADAWEGEENLYSQVASIEGVTEYSQVDLTPSIEQLAVFYEKDLAFVTENEGGVVTVYAIGQKPQNDYTVQVTITEVEYE